MAKSDTLQLRIDPFDMQYLRKASDGHQMSLSDFARHELEPAIVAAKVSDIARDFPFIKRVTMFGSMARGEHDSASDIDLAIETDGAYRWMGDAGMGRFVGRVEEATKRGVDVVKKKFCSTALAESIERDGRLVYER